MDDTQLPANGSQDDAPPSPAQTSVTAVPPPSTPASVTPPIATTEPAAITTERQATAPTTTQGVAADDPQTISVAAPQNIALLLQDERISKILDSFIPNKTTRRLKNFLAIATVFVAMFGYFAKWDSERSDRRANQIRDDIHEKITWLQNISTAIMNVRETRWLIATRCEYGKPDLPYEQARLRRQALSNLIKAGNGADQIFKHSDIRQRLIDFVSFDDNIKDVCSKGAPDDDVWRAQGRIISQEMVSVIERDRRELRKLSGSLTEKLINLIMHQQ